jgi:hypothetical protein
MGPLIIELPDDAFSAVYVAKNEWFRLDDKLEKTFKEAAVSCSTALFQHLPIQLTKTTEIFRQDGGLWVEIQIRNLWNTK